MKIEHWYEIPKKLPPSSGAYLTRQEAYIGPALWDEGGWSTLDSFQERVLPGVITHWAPLPCDWREHAALVEMAHHIGAREILLCKNSIKDMKYQIIIRGDYTTGNSATENIDVVVDFENGRHYSATLATLENVAHLMALYQINGECHHGDYFWALNLVLVKILSRETIETLVSDLIASGDFEHAFAGSYELER